VGRTVEKTRIKALEFIDGHLYGVGTNEPRYEALLFDEQDGSVLSITPLPASSVLGIAQVGNEIYMLNSGDLYSLLVYDLSFNHLRTISTSIENQGTISGFAAIGNDLFIMRSSHSSVLKKLDASTAFRSVAASA